MMALRCSKILCGCVSQKSRFPVAAVFARGATQKVQAGSQRKSIKACLNVTCNDELVAVTSAQGLALQDSELITENPVLDDGLIASNYSKAASASLDPNAFVFGIDPDVHGAMAVLRFSNSTDITFAEVLDVPTVRVMIGSGYRNRHDPQSLVSMIKELNVPEGSVAYLEQNCPLPKDGKLGWWGSGYGYGVWIGTLVALGISVVPVPPVVWKRALRLTGKTVTKDDCRVLASRMFPSLAPQLGRKKDHGRAEALLIAAYGKGIQIPTDSTVDETTSPSLSCEENSGHTTLATQL